MDERAVAEISTEIGPDESLIWAGIPQQGFLLRPVDLYLIPFSIFFLGFSVFWLLGVIGSALPFFIVLGLPFVAMGIYLTFGRFIVDARIRANTFYGLTNQRIIIITGLRSRTTSSLLLKTLHDVSLQQRSAGSGTVLFARSQHPFADWYVGMHWMGTGNNMTPRFEYIPDARQVYDLVLATQRAAV